MAVVIEGSSNKPAGYKSRGGLLLYMDSSEGGCLLSQSLTLTPTSWRLRLSLRYGRMEESGKDGDEV